MQVGRVWGTRRECNDAEEREGNEGIGEWKQDKKVKGRKG